MGAAMDRLPESSAAERNKQPILEVLSRVLAPRGTVLEIASGTGQHVLHFASTLTQHVWLPSDANPENLTTIRARIALVRATNIGDPLLLDVHQHAWPPLPTLAGVVCINMIHIAPWSATGALMRGVAVRSVQDPW
jgi:hypothetical protein